jgi:AraC-like DNA-binding protein
MKALSFKVPKDWGNSIKIYVDEGSYLYDRLHFHPEYQISLILKGKGDLYVGDSVKQFSEGDLFLLGSYLPHVFKSAPINQQGTCIKVRSITIFFSLESLGNGFFDLHESRLLRLLLEQAKYGLRFNGIGYKIAYKNVKSLLHLENFPLVLGFLQVLHSLSSNPCRELLSNSKFINKQKETTHEKVNDIYHYIAKNYNRNITLNDIAAYSNMSIPSFSRYFKLHTQKTFIEFLNEVRINKACELLKKTNYSISQICYLVGYNNLSNFNRHFKRIRKETPSNYLQFYQ